MRRVVLTAEGLQAHIDVQKGIGLYLLREAVAKLWDVPTSRVTARYA